MSDRKMADSIGSAVSDYLLAGITTARNRLPRIPGKNFQWISLSDTRPRDIDRRRNESNDKQEKEFECRVNDLRTNQWSTFERYHRNKNYRTTSTLTSFVVRDSSKSWSISFRRPRFANRFLLGNRGKYLRGTDYPAKSWKLLFCRIAPARTPRFKNFLLRILYDFCPLSTTCRVRQAWTYLSENSESACAINARKQCKKNRLFRAMFE